MTILPFTSPETSLETAGGKGANLGRLARAGFEVPPGFIVATDSYRAFVGANHLAEKIAAALTQITPDDAGGLDRASEIIRSAFSAGKVPDHIAESIRQAFASLSPQFEVNHPKSVAVRSSATSEDLPDLSFAGQQDTYLNVVGADAVLQAVVDCWSSLWTARAIGYRMRNHIPQDEVSLAVVVQQMVQSDTSGVLFTVNPLTGRRSESVIDATLGLGEALVSGQVEPDHYVLNTATGEIISKSLGAKKLATRAKSGGGTESVAEEAAGRQALSDDEIRQVAALGSRVQQEYIAPQDIEWAFADGGLYLLQSRPITSLFPVPETTSDRLEAWFSFGAVQGVLGPITPLGADSFRCISVGGARMFHVHTTYDQQQVLVPAGERVWIRFSDALRHPLGVRFIRNIMPLIEPGVAAILLNLGDEPDLAAGKGRFKPSTVWKMLRFAVPILLRVPVVLHNPEKARAQFDRLIERELAATHVQTSGDARARLGQRVDLLQARLTSAFPEFIPRFVPLLLPSLLLLNRLSRLDDSGPRAGHGFSTAAMEITRGLPNNVTTEMDLRLWETARAIRADADSLRAFTEVTAPELATRYRAGSLPQAALRAIAAFLDRYGARGVAEIDIGQPRWSDDPTPIMQSLQSYLQISDENAAPDVLFARGQRAAEQAIETLAAEVRTQRDGRLKQRFVRLAGRRVRVLLGARESPKFYLVRMIGILRRELLQSGADLVTEGVFERPDDVFFLHIPELRALAGATSALPEANQETRALVASRRAAYARELRRRQIPRVLLSDGRAFYEGLGAGAGEGEVITGSPVSPGVVEGVVHIVFDPHQTQLAPGEILVCPGTDPAWTPLFMAAGGLVTEVGGMMTHGSVVAREYGIPAVVGVHQATQRLKDGQRIRLDGTAGKILIIG
jgi:rifampicin phosphotransferase